MASSALAALWLKSNSKNGRANGRKKRRANAAEAPLADPTLNIGRSAVTGSGHELAAGVIGVGVTAQGGLNLGQHNNRNVYLGYRSGPATADTTGSGNTFVGTHSGRSNTSGLDNTFVGGASGTANTTGISNTFCGRNSGKANTTGSSNTFTGSACGQANTDGKNNTFAGANSGIKNTSSNDNTYLGAASGIESTGEHNTFVGAASGASNTSGSKNIALGFWAGPSEGNLQNAGAIGFRAKVSQSNSLVLGGTGPHAVRVGIGTPAPQATLHVIGDVLASGAITQLSDAQFKTDVQPLQNALGKVLALQGVRFRWRAKEFPAQRFATDPQVGLVAQEVAEHYPELVCTDARGHQSLDYGRLTAVLVEAMKEQQAQIEALGQQLQALKNAHD
ncbi:tail fiber domain-containing protein [Hymenobacter latericus]|uniref:tail fiber domain-containing protein n=1 Tax=Hymenobacter sp. YIM 151858-1 TaxID=2987688 RepID=UPI002227C644|nr:tail fiber domain-containing protein [Hymenobacter sp. YIM 151858-1]UYZ59483.1 tail fiber domain-containing protein [Hymenobacter sp. YIM 151858-1]